MPKYVTVAAHLSLNELAHRYLRAVDPVERSHFHIIWFLAQGKRVGEVAPGLLPQEASLWYYNSVTIKNIWSQRKKR